MTGTLAPPVYLILPELPSFNAKAKPAQSVLLWNRLFFQQFVGLGAHGLGALRIFCHQAIVEGDQVFHLVALNVAGHALEVNRLRGVTALWIGGDQPLKEFVRRGPVRLVELGLAHAGKNKGNQLFWLKKTQGSGMFLAFSIHNQQTGRPFYGELRGKLFVICGNAKGDDFFVQKRNNFLIGVRDRVHLFAANSLRVEKIQEGQLLLLLRLFEPIFIGLYPIDC